MKNKVINLFGDKKIIQNEGVKYSELLKQFMEPFEKEFKDAEDVGEVLEFAKNAWNFGNMKQILPEDENINIGNYIDDQSEINVDLLNRMIDYKIAKFKSYTNFIVDYVLEETTDGPILTVYTENEESYLANMIDAFDAFEDDNSEEEFEENYINRFAIIVKPKQPFIDWLNTLYPEDDYEPADFEESNIYLLNDNIEDLNVWLKKKYNKIFMLELENWQPNKKEWPQKRNYKMFKQWFEINLSEEIFDLEKKPVLKSE